MSGKKTLGSRMMNTVRNNKTAVGVVTVVGAATALVIWARGCTPIEEPIRGNGVCEYREQYPYKQDSHGAVLEDSKGNKIPNPFYAPEDCYVGDGYCNQEGKLLDATGEPLDVSKLSPPHLIKQYTYGAPVNMVESANPEDKNFSPDCLRRDYSSESIVTRPRVKEEKAFAYLRQLTPEEQVQRDKNASDLPRGNNDQGKTISTIDERCNTPEKTYPPCSLTSDGPCHFEKHQECQPKAPAVRPPPPPPPAKRPAVRPRPEPEPPRPEPPPQVEKCGTLVRSSEQKRIGRWIQSAGNRSIDTLRGKLGGANVRMTLSSEIEVDSDGSCRYISGRLSGGGSSESVSGSTLSVSGFTIAPPGQKCRLTISNEFGMDSSQ